MTLVETPDADTLTIQLQRPMPGYTDHYIGSDIDSHEVWVEINDPDWCRYINRQLASLPSLLIEVSKKAVHWTGGDARLIFYDNEMRTFYEDPDTGESFK